MVNFDEEVQLRQLNEIHKKEEEDLTKILAKRHGLPYVDLSTMSIDLDFLKLIPENKAREGQVAIFQGVGKKIDVGIRNPKNELAINLIRELKGNEFIVSTFLVSLNSLKKAWSRYKEIADFVEMSKGVIGISSKRIEEFFSEVTTLDIIREMFEKRIKSQERRRVSELVEIMLSGALSMDASDIHIEPYEEMVKIRIRLDGVLHDVLEFDVENYKFLIARIKLVSEMKLNIRDSAQDGRFTIRVQDEEIEVRSSIIPGPYGESVVMRILNPKAINVDFEHLGMAEYLRNIIENEIKKPNGMILTTGPTGSGKTTTLYAFLKKIKKPEVKIITIENPIEYHLEGITQTQTNSDKGYTFATGLRSILRQDPDIIMVGEIRDLEAAGIALNAALTGHLVFSTLHTNDAAGTIPRLIDLGANPAIIAPAINVSMAQRLTRKLCDDCKEELKPSKEDFELLKKVTESFPKNIECPTEDQFKIFGPKGCEKCNGIGYKGRVGIFEAILIDGNIEELVLKNPSEVEIKQVSAKQGILNLEQDAVLKIITGITSLEEARRVVEIS